MWFGKRSFDLFFSLIGIILLAPFFILISILILFTDYGPIFFTQNRVGFKGKRFKIIKFRTMLVDENKNNVLLTVGNDSRVTRIGRMLRATKLDELPQLLNVLKGEMSFVGPRPEVEKYIALLSEIDRTNILSLKPGITDLASIEFCDEAQLLEASSSPEKLYIDEILPKKIQLSMQYRDIASLAADVRIVFKTLQRIV